MSESSAGGRGGSSTLPHKRNPVGSALAIACAHGVRGAASVLIAAPAQEHERAAGAWQAEWEALSRALGPDRRGGRGMSEALDGLEVDTERMRANLELTGGALLPKRSRPRWPSALGARGPRRSWPSRAARLRRRPGPCATS